MKVESKFEVKHFVTYLGMNGLPTKMEILGKEGKFHKTKVNGEDFEVHEDALSLIRVKCPSLSVVNKMLQ